MVRLPTKDLPAQRRTLHGEIKNRIAAALSERRWKHGQAIPSEPALARRFGVSVGTVRRAVSELVAENVLVRRQGSGTYVASHTRDYMLNVFFCIVDAEGRKELPRFELLSFRSGRADARTAALLGIAARAPIFRVQALQYIGGMPMMVDDIRMPRALFPDLTEHMLRNRDGTLYGFLQERYGVTVLRVTESLQACVAPTVTRELLSLAPGAAVLRIERTACTYRDLPVETRVRHVNTAHLRYLSRLGRS